MLIAALLAATTPPAALDGVWTNEEQVYFDKEAGRTPPPWTGIRIHGSRWTAVDRFGQPGDAISPAPSVAGASSDRMIVTIGGQRIDLRRGRPMTCWMAVKKDKPKPDGSEDWLFTRGLELHDQGGRTRSGGEGTGAPEASIRVRNVIWPPPTQNRPSLVIYVFDAKDPDRAVSYSWADPGAKMLGINLRWMQASCTLDGGAQ